MDNLSRPTLAKGNFKLRSATTSDVKVLESQLSLRELDRQELLGRLTPLVGEANAQALLQGEAVDLDTSAMSEDQIDAVNVLMPRVGKFVRNR